MSRWSLTALVGSLATLASLYLPWQVASTPSSPSILGSTNGNTGLQSLFSSSSVPSVGGWSTSVSEPAALAALVLAGLLVVALARPVLLERVPIGLFAVLAAYFAFAIAVEARSTARLDELVFRRQGIPAHYHYAFGAYLGVAAAALALVAVARLRRTEIYRGNWSVGRVASVVAAAAALVSFLLPWWRVVEAGNATITGLESPAVVLAAVAICAAMASSSAAASLARACAAVLLVGAGNTVAMFEAERAYGGWLALSLVIVFAALNLAESRTLIFRPVAADRWASAVLATVTVLLLAMFAPWERGCIPTGANAERCLATNGWTFFGSTGVVLALLVVFGTLAARRLALSATELAVGVSLCIATLGFQLTVDSSSHLRYGAIVGFTATALLLSAFLVPVRPPRVSRPQILPIAACVCYLVMLVVPWWDVLPLRVEANVRLGPASWLTIASALVAIHLLGLWLGEHDDAVMAQLTWLPISLLAFAAVDLFRFRGSGMSWGGGAIVALCLVLAALGRYEAHGGLEKLRVPEGLRLDRI